MPAKPSKTSKTDRQILALLNDAKTMQTSHALAEAEEIYREILSARPKLFDALQLLGTLLLQSGRIDEGIDYLQQAASVNSTKAFVFSNLAYGFNTLGRFTEGLNAATRAVAMQPGFLEALNQQGNALCGLDRPADALTSYDKAVAANPSFAPTWSNRSCALRDLGRSADALSSCDEAIRLAPAFAEAWSNKGNALGDLGRPTDAQACYEQALKLAPDYVDAWSNMGLVLIDQGRHEDALACYDEALARRPSSAEAHWNKALCLLQLGRFAEGWPEYEWRWERERMKPSRRRFDQPMWQGDVPIEGKTILLHAEQGLGDTLQFCRYVPLVAARGARVLLDAPVELHRLLRTLDGMAELIPPGAPLPAFDYHCPLLSLPLAFRTDIDTIPDLSPYLAADASQVQVWAQRMSSKTGQPLKVGLVWAGGSRPHVPELRKIGDRRSITLGHFEPLLDIANVQFFSLQVGPASQQLMRAREAGSRAARIVDFTSELSDFADTAALVMNLDLVISVDTSTAHLAGALARPVWILNRFDSCWRWIRQRDDSPWYRTARLFNQSTLGDWDGVMRSVEHALRELAAAAAREAD